MKRKVFQKEKMDEIELRLIKSAGLRNDEIEKIVSNSQLFSSVLLKIEEEKKRQEPKIFYKNWFELPNLNWRIGLAFGLSVVFIAALTGLLVFRASNSSQNSLAENIDPSTSELPITLITPLTPPLITAPGSFKSPDIIVKRKNISHQEDAKTGNKVFSKAIYTRKITSPRRAKSDATEVFYPLIFAGDLNDADDERRIIRVGLTKELLASLGVDVPVMNENERIKGDLLISSDGVPQAVRFVKNSKNDFKKVRNYEKGS